MPSAVWRAGAWPGHRPRPAGWTGGVSSGRCRRHRRSRCRARERRLLRMVSIRVAGIAARWLVVHHAGRVDQYWQAGRRAIFRIMPPGGVAGVAFGNRNVTVARRDDATAAFCWWKNTRPPEAQQPGWPPDLAGAWKACARQSRSKPARVQRPPRCEGSYLSRCQRCVHERKTSPTCASLSAARWASTTDAARALDDGIVRTPDGWPRNSRQRPPSPPAEAPHGDYPSGKAAPLDTCGRDPRCLPAQPVNPP